MSGAAGRITSPAAGAAGVWRVPFPLAAATAFLAILFLLSIGWVEAAHVGAVFLVFGILARWLVGVAESPRLAMAVVLMRLAIVLFAAFYLEPFLESQMEMDAQLYHAAGVQIANTLLRHGTLEGTGEVWGTNTYAVFTGICYSFFGKSSLLMTAFNSLIAGIGSFLFYRTLTDHYGKSHWVLKYLILFDPSLMYWSSIHGKDPYVFFFLAVLLYSLSRLLRLGKRRALLSYGAAVVGLFLIRPHTALLGVVCVVLTLSIVYLRSSLPNRAIKLCLVLSGIAVFAVAAFVALLYVNLEDFSNSAILAQLSSLVGGLATGGTALDVPQFSSWFDFFAYLPKGVVAVLFRPFPWEPGSTLVRLVGLYQLGVSIGVLCLVWRCVRYVATSGEPRRSMAKDPLGLFLLLYCAGFSLMYAAISGNLGYLARERIQLLPFLWCALAALDAALRMANGSRNAVRSHLAEGDASGGI